MSKKLNYKNLNKKRSEASEKQELFLAEIRERAARRITSTGRSAWDELREKYEFKIKSQGYRIAYLEKKVAELEARLKAEDGVVL